jgi:hypothetical protein
MDMICPRCTEPWDNDSLHEEVEARASYGLTLEHDGSVADYRQVAAEFRQYGCGFALASFIGGREGYLARWDWTPIIRTNPDGSNTISTKRRVSCVKVSSMRQAAASALADLLGDDTDGYMSMMDDADFAGLLD